MTLSLMYSIPGNLRPGLGVIITASLEPCKIGYKLKTTNSANLVNDVLPYNSQKELTGIESLISGLFMLADLSCLISRSGLAAGKINRRIENPTPAIIPY